ncbi:MAG: SGNH/GDSL hydrolase family protein [Microthrixaceae bacterium]|nr:SGNH/GDSL hydrolase family protein [Microthrixaceae bacterium]MCO5311589.1 SGNH/GDSL hydrolase family protein [Microthrixaceae bacterium]
MRPRITIATIKGPGRNPLIAITASAVIALAATGCRLESPASGTVGVYEDSTSIVAIGDSQTSVHDHPQRGPSWADRIPGVTNGAAGMGGGGWRQRSARTNQTIDDRTAQHLNNHADHIVVMAGVNDLNNHWLAQDLLEPITAWKARLDAANAQYTVIGVVPYPRDARVARTENQRQELNASFAEVFRDRYLDCDSYLSDEDGWLLPGLSLSATDLHLNSAGEQKLADCVIQSGLLE